MVERNYDAVGNLVELHNIEIGLGDQISRSYDALNRMISETINYGAFSKTVQYSYDPGGRLTRLIDPDGMSIIREYNEDNDLVGVTDPYDGITTINHDAGGNNTQTNLPGGEWNTSAYDGNFNLLNRTTNDTGGANLFTHEYQYDPLGNILQSTRNGLPKYEYSYDALNRLNTASYPWHGQNIQYSYDPVGNRISKDINSNITSFTYNAENRVISQTFPDMSVITYDYDNNGNVIQTSSDWGIVSYQYDFENKLVHVGYPPAVGYVANFFSPEGKRLARDDKGLMTFYFPTLLGTVLEMDATGNTMVRLNPGISQARDLPAGIGMEGTHISYSHWGESNSTTEFTSDGLEASFEFDHFGAILASTGDIDAVEPGLYAEGNKVDWDPLLGAELIGIDYAPDIDQHLGNSQFSPIDYFGPGSDPFDNLVYSIYRNDRKQQDLSTGFGPGSDPFDNQVYSLSFGSMQSFSLHIFGPENLDNTPGVNGSDGSDASNKDTEICGFGWLSWETTGTIWVYVGCYADKSYLPQKRLYWKFEKKKQQTQWNNVCLLEKGHSGHHRKSVSAKTGKTGISSYSPPVFKKVYSESFTGPWPKKKWRDKKGKEKEKELNR